MSSLDTSGSSSSSPSDTDSSSVASSSSSSSDSRTSSPMKSPQGAVTFDCHLIPLLPKSEVYKWCMTVWTLPPAQRYLEGLLLEPVKNADAQLWTGKAGQAILKKLDEQRGTFLRAMETACIQQEATQACVEFCMGIEDWILSLRRHAKDNSRPPTKRKKASVLQVSLRSRNLIYKEALRELGNDPKVSRLQKVRHALKQSR